MACQTDFSTIITADGNITSKRSDTFHLETEFLYADNDDPFDLSNFDTIIASVKTDPKESNYVMQFSIGDGFSVNGNLLIWDKNSTDMNIEPKGYFYDIEATAGADVQTIGGGSFTVIADVTRNTDTP
jgi:hypothetical protein